MLDDTFLLAQQALRLSSGYDWLMFVSRVLHIFGAIIMVGGLFYLWAVVTPATAVAGGEPADQYFGGRRASWAKWIGIASALLLVTGLWNFVQMIKTNEIATSYHMVGGIKILLALALMFLSALLAGRTNAAEAVRRNWRRWLSICLILGILTVAIGSLMRAYNRTPKVADAANGPVLLTP